MPIRISSNSSEGVRTLRVEGRLLSEDLTSLGAEYDRHPGPVRLDLSEVHFADRKSVEMLQGLLDDRAELAGARPYLKLLLDARADQKAPGGPPIVGGSDGP